MNAVTIRWVTATFILVVADQATKAMADAFLKTGQVVPLLGSWAGLTLRHNAAFIYGVGAGIPMIQPLTVIASLMGLGLLIWLYRTQLRDRYDPFWTALYMVLSIASTIGNLLDRLMLGYVRDFLKLRWIGTVNLADIYATACVVALVVALRRKPIG